jgi:hypothetical protein
VKQPVVAASNHHWRQLAGQWRSLFQVWCRMARILGAAASDARKPTIQLRPGARATDADLFRTLYRRAPHAMYHDPEGGCPSPEARAMVIIREVRLACPLNSFQR